MSDVDYEQINQELLFTQNLPKPLETMNGTREHQSMAVLASVGIKMFEMIVHLDLFAYATSFRVKELSRLYNIVEGRKHTTYSDYFTMLL